MYYSMISGSRIKAVIVLGHYVRQLQAQHPGFDSMLDVNKINEFIDKEISRSTLMELLVGASLFPHDDFLQKNLHHDLFKALSEDPSTWSMNALPYFYKMPYAEDLLLMMAKQNPVMVVGTPFDNVPGGSKMLLAWLAGVKNDTIRLLVNIRGFNETTQIKERMSLLLDDLVKKNLTLEQARVMAGNPIVLLRHLIEIQSRPVHLGSYAIDHYISNIYLQMVSEINALHAQSPEARFASVKRASAEELYRLITYGQDELYTSSFNGIFNRMLARMQFEKISGQALLEKTGYYNLRGFVQLMVGFNRLGDFLKTMTKDQQIDFLKRFVVNIDKEDDFLRQASGVADAFSMIKDPEQLAMLQALIKQEFERVSREESRQGVVIYGLLSGMFGQKAVRDAAWFESMASQYRLPDLSILPASRLFDVQGRDIQRYYFYADEDGQTSFNNFVQQYANDPHWQVRYYQNFDQITSVSGRDVQIFANKPRRESEAEIDIDSIFLKRFMKPQVLVQRGHVFHLSEFIEHLTPANVFVGLGSCGGFNNIAKVLDRSGDAQVFSTKGTGSKWINDPVLKMINDEIREGRDINWPLIWATAGKRFGENNALFNDYIPPHMNLSVMFIKAYNALMKQEAGKPVGYQAPLVPTLVPRVPEGWVISGYGMVPAGKTAVITGFYGEPAVDHALSLKGGIDLDPAALHIESRGTGFSFNAQTLEALDRTGFNGFSPVIMDIKPAAGWAKLLALE